MVIRNRGFLGDEWDTIMNYDAFMEPIAWFLTGMEKHSDEYRGECFGNPGDFEGAMRHHMTRFMTSSLQCAMNELSNHDHSRFLTRTNKKSRKSRTIRNGCGRQRHQQSCDERSRSLSDDMARSADSLLWR